MLFNSFSFFLFFIFVSFSYYTLPHKYRWMLLLCASSYFYMAFIPKYILILFATILVNYLAGILLEKNNEMYKKYILWITILINIGILAFFKYFNFFIENINTFGQVIHWNYSFSLLHIILPIGLSFHTFQALSYVIEVYKGRQKTERHFGIYSLYVMYYPQLVAGPIERPQNLLHQFHEKKFFKSTDITEGLKRMAWGFFKKTVVADHLAIIVNTVYSSPQDFTGPILIMATVFFAFQIYCDFSGYSDIAVGASKVMGISLMENFRRPYFSKTISEFWKRWHISLSSWFRDYVFIPLGGSFFSPIKTFRNILIVFILSGFWHGANWTFIIWGLLNGFYLVIENIYRYFYSKNIYILNMLSTFLGFSRYIQILTTFAFTCIGWVFFRANSLTDAFYILRNFGNGTGDFIVNIFNYYTWKNLFSLHGLITKNIFVIAFVSLIVFIIVEIIERRISIWQKIAEQPVWFRWFMYYSLVFSIITFGSFGLQDFIYFQF